MRKVLSKTFIIIAAVLVALLIAILVLCLVRVKPLGTLDGYSRIEVYNLSATERIEVENGSDNHAPIKDALDKSSYSVMQGWLEGKFSTAFKFKTETLEGASEATRVEIEADDLGTIAATATLYKLVFVYPETKTVSVEGEEIKFDRAVMLVGDSNNEIGTVEITFYEDARVGNEADDEELSSEYYSVSPVIIRARTTTLYAAIGDFIKAVYAA